MKFIKGQLVWCRPTVSDSPIQAVYNREITEEENRVHGYRFGHLVEIDGHERWIRLDLCGLDKDEIADVSGSGY